MSYWEVIMNENLVLAKKFLFKWFILGFILLLISSIGFIFVKDIGAEWAQSWYNVQPEVYFNTMFIFIGVLKLFIFTMLLAPALALHCLTSKCCKDK